MRTRARLLAFAGACSLLVSCNPLLTGPLPAGMTDSAMVQHVPYSGSFTYTVDPGTTPRDVYFVFTNPSLTQNASQAPSVANGSIEVDAFTLPAPTVQPLPAYDTAPQSLTDRIAEFNRNPRAYLPQGQYGRPSAVVSPAGSDVFGSTGSFAIADPNGGNFLVSVNATCKAHVGPVSFADGRARTLSIWVDDNYWTVETTPAMVTALATRFLQSPESLNDIYHWDTSVVGEPWGPVNDPSLITWDANNTITILLTHLNPLSAYSGGSVIVGYFWAKDNFAATVEPGSNQRIMFYIDSKLYSTVITGAPYFESPTWAPTDHWPSIVFSTLAHEFQHMIQFYQKQVVLGAQTGTDTWINEMCSMLMEDLVADKLGGQGPRGVSTPDAGAPGNIYGRIPYFNASSNASLAVAGSGFGLTQYAVAYTFGAWLIRNYGGPDLLRRIVQCPQTDSSAVVNAVSAYTGKTETMEKLLERWAASVLLSDTTTAPPGYRYNTGGWSSYTVGNLGFNLGSIDIFNYSPQLTTYSTTSPIPAPPYYSSNVYYLAASKLNSAQTFKVTLPVGTDMSIVLK
jgi:hypothetical protein